MQQLMTHSFRHIVKMLKTVECLCLTLWLPG